MRYVLATILALGFAQAYADTQCDLAGAQAPQDEKCAHAWMDENRPQNDELKRFRREAAALLGIDEPQKPDDRAAPPQGED